MTNYPFDAWNYKEVWKKYGEGFCVEVSRHSVERSMLGQGLHRWCVYVYIYPTHPLFAKIDRSLGMYQDTVRELPLHNGPSFFQCHADNDGNITSIQVGADYNHLYDDYFTHYETANDAMEVFLDAEDLIKFMTTSIGETTND